MYVCIEGLIKYNNFPRVGTVSVTRLTVVKNSVVEKEKKRRTNVCIKLLRNALKNSLKL